MSPVWVRSSDYRSIGHCYGPVVDARDLPPQALALELPMWARCRRFGLASVVSALMAVMWAQLPPVGTCWWWFRPRGLLGELFYLSFFIFYFYFYFLA
jgi:hypothetical protein